MKLIITESQKNKIIEKVIFKHLDKQNYNQLEFYDNIYFVKNIGDENADIRFDEDTGWCYINNELISFFSRMMGVKNSDIKEVIKRWVEHTLQMKVKYTQILMVALIPMLNIPYNNT